MMSLEIDFQSQKILVTGAASGIGLEICKRLHEQKAKVYGLDINSEGLEQLQKACPGICVIQADLLNWKETRDKLKDLEALDGLVNNAGLGVEATFMKTTPEDFDRVMGVNLNAVINVSQMVAKKMIENKIAGRIVNISSLASVCGTRVSVPYNVSKAALDMITKTMALELGEHNIGVNSVNPQLVRTDLLEKWMQTKDGGKNKQNILNRTPLARMVEINEVINAVLFLLSKSAAPMVNGIQMFLDGGYRAA